MIQSILSLMGLGPIGTGQGKTAQENRAGRYLRCKRLYDGYAIRSDLGGDLQYKPLRYNLALPVANVSADFLAAKDIQFVVQGNEAATKKAMEIWETSGGGAAFLENALSATIYGDSCIVARLDETKGPLLNWVDPTCCMPQFNIHDLDVLDAMIITYNTYVNDQGLERYKEVWKDGKVTVTINDVEKPDQGGTYDPEAFGGPPIVWIRNQKMKGEMFGRSDLLPVLELVEQYDHLMGKMSRIVDYYSSPNLFVKGVVKGQLPMSRGEKTMYYLPENGDMGFVEWKGTAVPDVRSHIQDVRENICELTETPQIVFSRLEGAFPSAVSGIALRMLYSPLIKKTDRKRKAWQPALCKAMSNALLLAGIEVKPGEMTIEWQDPMPSNDLESWQIAGLKEALGVSKDQILREQGYTEEEIEQFKEENAEEADAVAQQAAAQFAAGNPMNDPYQGKPVNSPPKPGQPKPGPAQQQQQPPAKK